MATNKLRHLVYGFTILCLINGVYSVIIEHPMNSLVVLCKDNNAVMSCNSTEENEITWTYDGNAVISGACQSVGNDGVFEGYSMSPHDCQLNASQSTASTMPTIRSISGPYGCTDRASLGVTATSMVVVLDMWCGVVDNCVVRENNSVTFGCYVQYDWLSYLIQYNPIVRLNSSLHFVEDPSTRDSKKPQVNFGVFGHPSEELRTTYTVPNVQPGQTLTAECRIDLTFDLSTGYSGRNTYAPNPLSHSCFVNRTVHYCPINVRIEPAYSCQAYQELTCYADSYPPASYIWIDHIRNTVTEGQKIILQPGPFRLTCIANTTVRCSEANNLNTPCQINGSLASKHRGDPTFPFKLFGTEAFYYNFSESCQANASIDGYAVACPNITMEALNGSVCPNNSEVVLEKPSTVTFNCIYEIPPPRMTNYTWLLDGEVLFSEFNMTVAHIPIPPGTHYVTCKANIDITGAFGERSNNTEDCACAAAWTIPVTVVECTDNVTISPWKVCVQQGQTFTCLATHGHQDGPYYTWTDLTYPTPTSGPSYNLSEIGYHNLMCEAEYRHRYCPGFHPARCSENITVRVFQCPNMTLQGNSTYECPKTSCTTDEIILTQPSTVDFHCDYENPPSTTEYEWYLDGVKQPTTTSNATFEFMSNSSTTLVECRAVIEGDEDCKCNSSRAVNVTVVECKNPTISPMDTCVPQTTEYTCTATSGYPGAPNYGFYYWKHVSPSSRNITRYGYEIYEVGNFSLYCDVTYSHHFCTECSATCNANFTGTVFACPNMTLQGNSTYECSKTSCTTDEIILTQPSTVDFHCDYENPPSTTEYEWYLDGVKQPATASKASITITESGSHSVECRGMIDEDDKCKCHSSRTLNITVVGCKDPTISPRDTCIPQGTNYTCTATSGYPGAPNYGFYYLQHGSTSSSSISGQSYEVNAVGNCSLFCGVTYSHHTCTDCSATCNASVSATVYECPDNISLYHNASSYSTPSPLYNVGLFFNGTTAVRFECIYETIYYPTTKFTWTVSYDGARVHTSEGSRYLEYYFANAGEYVVMCYAGYVISNCPSCNKTTSVPITIDVPEIETCRCPFPHWPPVIPPIIAILISILMIPCYCYSCGPWSGPYWAEERKKLIEAKMQQSYSSRAMTTNDSRSMLISDSRSMTSGYSEVAIRRPLTNGYGQP